VKLLGETTTDVGKQEENAAAFFSNKVRDIRSTNSTVLADRRPEPMSSDVPHMQQLSESAPATPSEVLRLLSSMLSKSSPLDTVPTSQINACS
jgi:hypothetical protein